MRITATAVKSLLPVSKPRTFFDTDLKGFGIRCTPPSARSPQGAATWVVEYRPGGGGRRVSKQRLTIGSASLLDAAEARKQARGILADVQRGDDPVANRRQARAAATISELVGKVTLPFGGPGYQANGAPNRKRRSSELYASYWRLHILPIIGAKRARDLTHADVVRLHAAIGEKHRVTANRCVSLLRHFYGWAAKMRFRRV